MCGVETKNKKNNRILGSANAGRMGLYPAYPASTKCVSCYFFVVNPADLIAPASGYSLLKKIGID
jgi:hypothetical protein